MSREDTPSAEPLFLTALRAFIYSLTVWVMLYGLALGAGIFGGVIGAVAAVFLARFFEFGRVRGPVVFTVVLGGLVVGGATNLAMTGWGFVARVVGVELTLSLADFLVFGMTIFATVLALRALAERVQALAVLEVGVITAGVVRLVAGHRDHAISEPRFLSDWVWSQGGDPMVALLALGGIVLATVPLMLLVKQRLTKAALSVSALVLLGFFAFFLLTVDRPEPEPPTGGMGLAGKAAESDEGESRPGGGSSRPKDDPTEMPFESEAPEGEPKPVAIVLLHDDYVAPDGYLYFRQTAFSQYNGYRLVRSFERGADTDLPTRFASRQQLEVSDLGLDPDDFVEVETTVALVTDHKKPFGLSSATSFESVPNPNSGHFRRAYKVSSLAPKMRFEALLKLEAGDPKWSEELRELYTRMPDDPRYKALSQEIVAGLSSDYSDNPMAKALAIRRWLEKNTVYTLRSSHAGEADPTASFLFGSRRGYCVHLAHSVAFLLRSLGVPTRVAAGYLVDESRRANGSAVLIQNRDAHAWAEVYLDGAGWVVVDVSPEQADEGSAPPINPDLQRVLGELARGDETAGKQVDHDSGLRLWRWLGYAALPLLFFLLAALYTVKLWRRVVPAVAGEAQRYRLTYRAALDKLAEVGLARDYGETREAFSRRVSPSLPAFEAMTNAHLRAALKDPQQPTMPPQWLRLGRDLDVQIKARYPLWRRALGIINPFSWIKVR